MQRADRLAVVGGIRVAVVSSVMVMVRVRVRVRVRASLNPSLTRGRGE